MIKKLSRAILLLASFTAIAQTPAPVANRSPYFARVGDTVFISGHFLYWSSDLNAVFNPTKLEDRLKLQEFPVRNFVMMNVVTNRPSKSSGYLFKERFDRFGVDSTFVMGNCDLYCARIFVAGKRRQLAQDAGSLPSRVAFQIPYNIGENWESTTLDRTFPASQLIPFEAAAPEFFRSNKELLTKAFTKPLDGNGGLFVGQDVVTYCDSGSLGSCEPLSGITAFSMGLTTAPERAFIPLPPNFGAPQPSSFAKLEDVDALPVNDNALRDIYRTFLKQPKLTGRFFALSESGDSAAWSWGSDNAWGNAPTRALNGCERKSTSKCRLYAVGDQVVW